MLRTRSRYPVTLAFCALSFAPVPALFAQEVGQIPIPAVEVSAGYTFMRDFSEQPKDLDFPAGWYAATAVNLNDWFGIVGEGTASYKNNFTVSFPDMSEEANRLLSQTLFDARVYTLMGGPRFFHQYGRIAPFGQFLLGGAHMRATTTFPTLAGNLGKVSADTTEFAFQPGGGITVYVTERLGVRFAADYRCIVDFVDGDAEYTNEFRMISGFTVNWGSR